MLHKALEPRLLDAQCCFSPSFVLISLSYVISRSRSSLTNNLLLHLVAKPFLAADNTFTLLIFVEKNPVYSVYISFSRSESVIAPDSSTEKRRWCACLLIQKTPNIHETYTNWSVLINLTSSILLSYSRPTALQTKSP